MRHATTLRGAFHSEMSFSRSDSYSIRALPPSVLTMRGISATRPHCGELDRGLSGFSFNSPPAASDGRRRRRGLMGRWMGPAPNTRGMGGCACER